MRRPEARTVSYTVVRLDDSSVRMDYYAAAPDQDVEPTIVSLDLVRKKAALVTPT
jgi:hypothetical protein